MSAFGTWAGRLEDSAEIAGPDDYEIVRSISPAQARTVAALLRRAERLEAALRGIESMEAKADSLVGFVDYPQVKAMRAMAREARAALAEPAGETKP